MSVIDSSAHGDLPTTSQVVDEAWYSVDLEEFKTNVGIRVSNLRDELDGSIRLALTKCRLNIAKTLSCSEKDDPEIDHLISIAQLSDVPLLCVEVWIHRVTYNLRLKNLVVYIWVDV